MVLYEVAVGSVMRKIFCVLYFLQLTLGDPSISSTIKRLKMGSTVNLNCNKATKVVSWLFKRCIEDYRGIYCDNDIVHPWRVLGANYGEKIMVLRNVSIDNAGIYKCISGNLAIRTFVVEIDPTNHEWPPPKVLSVIPSDNVVQLNGHLTINCSVISKIPPKILWFKECWTSDCEIDVSVHQISLQDDYNCLCLINHEETILNLDNIYISKLHIFNTHVWDGGTYVCSALSSNGKDFKNVTVVIEESNYNDQKREYKSYVLLLFIPLLIILLYIISYKCCIIDKKKINNVNLND